MCYNDGRLMAYLDGETDAETSSAIRAHLIECAECSAELERLASDRSFAAEKLGELEPVGEVVPMPVSSEPKPRRATAKTARRFALRPSQLAAAAAVVLALSSLGFTPVRDAVANVLQIFRAQSVQTLSLSQEDLNKIDVALRGSGHVSLKKYGDVWVEGASMESSEVPLAQAQAAVDFPVKLVPSESGTPTITLTSGGTYRFELNVSAINEVLTQYGSDTLMSDSVDGKVFSVVVPPIIMTQYPQPEGEAAKHPHKTDNLSIGQGRSPQLIVPDGVDPAQLRKVLIDLPLLPQEVRRQIADVKQWQTTLLVPSYGGKTHNVTIDGAPALVIHQEDVSHDGPNASTSVNTTVIWNDNGAFRAVNGAIDEKTATALAQSMMR
jgi:hypothetical protein